MKLIKQVIKGRLVSFKFQCCYCYPLVNMASFEGGLGRGRRRRGGEKKRRMSQYYCEITVCYIQL